MSFKKNKYTIIKQAISKDLATFIANYFRMQKQVYDTCKAARYFSPFESILGFYEDQMVKYQIHILNMQIWLWKLYCLNVNQIWKKQQD